MANGHYQCHCKALLTFQSTYFASDFIVILAVTVSCCRCNSTMSDAYASVDIPKSLPIHGMALTSTGRKIEHSKVVVDTQTYESNGSVSLKNLGFACLRGVAVLL